MRRRLRRLLRHWWTAYLPVAITWMVSNVMPEEPNVFVSTGVFTVLVLGTSWWLGRRFRWAMDEAEAESEAEAEAPTSTRPPWTAEQMELLELANRGDHLALIGLWESIYGRPLDRTRNFAEVVEEVSLALRALSS